VNEANNHRRWFVRHCKLEVPLEETRPEHPNSIEYTPDPGRSPFEQAMDSETRTLIERALTQINPVFRTAVVLRDVQNLSYEEIAEILQVSLGTVKSRILRGREALRRELTQRPDQGLAEAIA
jgi:RNA polymerase sigma-70 factor (ECF subfamily)